VSTTTIGIGRLTWPSRERITDRYGLVGLLQCGDSTSVSTDWAPLDLSGVGEWGRLQATVLETRRSTHVGDRFRGLFPSTPKRGEVIKLGVGLLFTEPIDVGTPGVGLQPTDERATDWLDPAALYRAHEQTVRLEFVASRPTNE
jgi:hypothetical protein